MALNKFMKVFNLICAGAVFVCAVVLSYHHSVELMAAGGYQWIFRHLAVVLVELTFIAGAANLVLARIQKRSPGVPPVLGALFGVVLTGWANIRAGIPYGKTGIVLGAMVPIALVISEAILAHFLLHGAGTGAGNTNENTKSEDTRKSTSTPDAKHQAPVIPNSHQVTAATKPPAVTSQSEKTTTKQAANDKPTSDKPTSNKPTTTQKKGRKETVDIEVERAKRVAKRILEEEGKLPGRPRLMKEAGIRENPARKALEELKQAL